MLLEPPCRLAAWVIGDRIGRALSGERTGSEDFVIGARRLRMKPGEVRCGTAIVMIEVEAPNPAGRARLAQMFERHAGAIRRTLQSRGLSSDAADDATQQAFL